MKIIVSACLLGENCKYNGSNNYRPALIEYLKGKEIIPVCPEMAGGLPAPRASIELRDNVPYDKEGNDFTVAFRKGIESVLNQITGQEVALAVLQSRSPTCGVGRIYDGSFQGKLIPGDGKLVQALRARNIPVYDVEEFLLQRPLDP